MNNITNTTATFQPSSNSSSSINSYNSSSFTSSTLIPLIICGIFGVGSVGNALIIFVISKSKNLRKTATNIYILNMAITDLLFVSSLPLFALQYAMNMQWPFSDNHETLGNFVCKTNRMITRLNLFCTIYFIMALALHRWMMINPNSRKKSKNSNNNSTFFANFNNSGIKAKKLCLLIWCLGFFVSIPDFVYSSVRFSKVTNSSVCAFGPEIKEKADISFYMKFMGYFDVVHFVITYIFPSTVILVCYVLLIRLVNKKLVASQRTKSASKTVLTVVVAYYVCWTPYNIHKILRSICGYFRACSAETSGLLRSFFSPIEPFLIILAFSNSCLNPIIYAFTLDQFNDSLIKVSEKF